MVQLPGIAAQRLMNEGYGFGGEGDWKTAALGTCHESDGQRIKRRKFFYGRLHLSF